MSRALLREAFDALQRDLIVEGGPRISTMRNYRFAIVQYEPELEYLQREYTQQLNRRLTDVGWKVLPISLYHLLLDRVRAQGDNWAERVIAMEQRMTDMDTSRGLGYLRSKLTPLIEGPEGLAADCAARIAAHVKAHPDAVDRMLTLIGGAGPLYPFFRSSALLKHLAGRTQDVPVVLLYPGKQRDGGLSFMGILAPDSDYRPRIYPQRGLL